MASKDTTKSVKSSDIETNVLWNRFQTIAEEMYDVTVRQAFSIVMREWSDTSSVVLTPDGEAVGMSKRSVPVLSGAIPRTARIMLDEHFSVEELSPGDALISNDPWIVAGHLPDIVLIEPVFYDDDVVALVGSLGNVGDIGGNLGMWAGDAQQYYEEGVYIPPLKLYDGGELNETVRSILRGNVRIPDQVMGDVEALHSANRVGIERIQEVIDEYGLDTFEAVTENVLQLSEEAMRNEIETIADGTYDSKVEYTVGDEEFGETHDLEVHVSVTVDGSDIHVDYTGTSQQQPAGLNCPYSSTRAFTNYVLECMTVPDINAADGLFEPLEITAPEGTILNPNRPAAVDSRHLSYFRLAEALIQALGQPLSERAVTSYAGLQIFNFNGVDEEGNEFIGVNLSMGTFPARTTKDGLNSVSFPSASESVPIEVFEQYCPVRFEERSLVPDSEGAGKYHSGFATKVVFHNPISNDINVSIVSNNNNDKPDGLNGGLQGQKATVESVNTEKTVPTNHRAIMEPGESISATTATSGGYGDPTERDPELVERDIRLGYVSEQRARDVYGYEG